MVHDRRRTARITGLPTRLAVTAGLAVSGWVRHSHVFDGVIDFDRAVRDPADPPRLLPGYDSGDHLHPSDAGYRAMGGAIPLALLR